MEAIQNIGMLPLMQDKLSLLTLLGLLEMGDSRRREISRYLLMRKISTMMEISSLLGRCLREQLITRSTVIQIT